MTVVAREPRESNRRTRALPRRSLEAKAGAALVGRALVEQSHHPDVEVAFVIAAIRGKRQPSSVGRHARLDFVIRRLRQPERDSLVDRHAGIDLEQIPLRRVRGPMGEDEAALWCPRRPPLVALEHRHALGHALRRLAWLCARRAHNIQIEAVAAVGGEGNALAVGRPRRFTLNGGDSGELSSLATVRLHRPDAIEHDDREALAVRRPRGIAHAWRPRLRARRHRQDRDHRDDAAHDGVETGLHVNDRVEAGLQTRLGGRLQTRLPSVTASTM